MHNHLHAGKVSTKGQTCVPASLVREGYVGICCARPQSDVVLRTHQGREVRLRRHEEEATNHK